MQQISAKRVWDQTRLDVEGDPLGIVQEIEILPYEKMVYAQTRIYLREWDVQSSLGFWDTNGSHNLGQMSRPRDSRQKKKKKKEKKRETIE